MQFGLESPEDSVPNDQDPAVVDVQVDLVGTVMGPMMRRRVEHKFRLARQSGD